MKIVIVGCTHAGTAAVVNLKELHPESEITIYEKNDNLSFLSCGIALNVGGVIKETKNLFYNSPENLAKMGVVTNMKHEVLNIDFDNKTLKVKNLLTNEEFEDNYDKLVLTLGSWPIVPRFEGGDLDNILLCKNHDHAVEIIEKSKTAKNVVIIGRSNIVGKPLLQCLLNKNATITICHSKTRDIKAITKNADILIAAVGRPHFVTEDMVKDGAVVIDVGINRNEEGKLIGDVDFENIEKKASYITPVPGGVGPMTIAMLMNNVVEAAKMQNGI